MNRRWLNRRALGLHLALVVIVPACLGAFWWQLDRALSGNSLSWAYCFEWPIFAVLAVVGWWQLLHESAEDIARRARHAPSQSSFPSAMADWPADEEDEELAAYNRYLAQLASDRRPKTWRRS